MSAAPYIGSKISLVTCSDLRYEGVLININTAQSTVTLRDVRMVGTDRPGQFVVPTPEIYDFIVFNGKDIKDLTVSEAASAYSIRQDPAVVAVNVPPAGFYDYRYQQRAGVGAPHRQNGPMGNMHGGHPHGAHPHARGGPPSGPRSRPINSRTVVGELSAQPNSSLKQQVADAFDFEQANTKFVPLEDPEFAPTAYNKAASFFDTISCEPGKPPGVRVDREKLRELDSETFGAAAVQNGPRYNTMRRSGFKRNGGPRLNSGPRMVMAGQGPHY